MCFCFQINNQLFYTLTTKYMLLTKTIIFIQAEILPVTVYSCQQMPGPVSDCESKSYGCVSTCCHAKKLMCCDCAIFVWWNYDFDNPVITAALSSHYREIRNKEFICKQCHEQLRRGIYMSQPLENGNHKVPMLSIATLHKLIWHQWM